MMSLSRMSSGGLSMQPPKARSLSPTITTRMSTTYPRSYATIAAATTTVQPPSTVAAATTSRKVPTKQMLFSAILAVFPSNILEQRILRAVCVRTLNRPTDSDSTKAISLSSPSIPGICDGIPMTDVGQVVHRMVKDASNDVIEVLESENGGMVPSSSSLFTKHPKIFSIRQVRRGFHVMFINWYGLLEAFTATASNTSTSHPHPQPPRPAPSTPAPTPSSTRASSPVNVREGLPPRALPPRAPQETATSTISTAEDDTSNNIITSTHVQGSIDAPCPKRYVTRLVDDLRNPTSNPIAFTDWHFMSGMIGRSPVTYIDSTIFLVNIMFPVSGSLPNLYSATRNIAATHIILLSMTDTSTGQSTCYKRSSSEVVSVVCHHLQLTSAITWDEVAFALFDADKTGASSYFGFEAAAVTSSDVTNDASQAPNMTTPNAPIIDALPSNTPEGMVTLDYAALCADAFEVLSMCWRDMSGARPC